MTRNQPSSNGNEPVVQPDVLIVGSGPSGATFARLLVDAGYHILMVEMGAQETAIPGDHKKNNYIVQKNINNFINVIQGQLEPLSVPTDSRIASELDPGAWSGGFHASTPGAPHVSTIQNGQNPSQDVCYNLDAAAATRTVGGMASHWTCCTPRQHATLERSKLYDDAGWDKLYSMAEKLIGTSHQDLFTSSIRHELIKRELQEHDYGNGPRRFSHMPLAVKKIEGQSYLEWGCSATVFGINSDKDIFLKTGHGGQKDKLFSLKSQCRCTRLVYKDGILEGALCKDLKTGEDFLVQAKKYVVCAGAILTPGILYNSGFCDKLPALGKYMTEQTMAFCQVVLSRKLVESVTEDKYDLGWKEKATEHHKNFPKDPLPFPFTDEDPQVYTPVSSEYPWHTQIHRDAFSYGQVPSTVDQRLIVDLRWFGMVEGVETNCVTFSHDITDAYGMPQPTFHYQVPRKDAERTHLMIADMCNVASKLGGFLPGAEPKCLVPGSALHISGTTRAGEKDDGTSVCDRTGKLWKTDDVWVGGCNVDPAGAATNPTLTAMAFAVAGAEAIIEELEKEGKGPIDPGFGYNPIG